MFGHMLSALKGVQPEILREHTEPRHPEGRARGQAVCFVTIQLQVASVYHTCSTDGTSRPPDAKCEKHRDLSLCDCTKHAALLR